MYYMIGFYYIVVIILFTKIILFTTGNATLDIRRQYSVAASIVTDAIIESYNTGQVVYLPKTTV